MQKRLFQSYSLLKTALHQIKEKMTGYQHNFKQLFCLDPARLDRIFELPEASIILPIESLKPTRKQQDGITRAFFYMKETYHGKKPRRKPIFLAK